MFMLFMDNMETLGTTMLFRTILEKSNIDVFLGILHGAVDISCEATSIVSDIKMSHPCILHIFFPSFSRDSISTTCLIASISTRSLRRQSWRCLHIKCTSQLLDGTHMIEHVVILLNVLSTVNLQSF